VKTLNEWLEAQKKRGAAGPYLLLDAAGLPDGAASLPEGVCDPFECLFTGDLAEELADVAPYLGRLMDTSSIVPALEGLLISQVAMLAIPRLIEDGSQPIFSDLHRHFRKFNVVYGPRGEPLFFRYYDGRTLPSVLQVLDPDQLRDFFGPFGSFLVPGHAGGTIQLEQNDGKLVQTSID
jgi:hypothetical protein